MTKSSGKRYEKAPFEVCVVRYTCPTCCRRWHSANGNLEDYQICKNCYEKCYPGSYKYQAPNKRGNQNPETYIPHNTELCGKCIRLGYSCMEELGLEIPNRVITNLEGESVSLDYSQDFSSYFKLAETSKKKSEKKRINKKQQQLLDKQAWALLMDAGKNIVVKEDIATNDKSEEKSIPKAVVKEEALTDNKEKTAGEERTNNNDDDATNDKYEEKSVPEVIDKEKVVLVDKKGNTVGEEVTTSSSNKENEVSKDEMTDGSDDGASVKSKEVYTEYINYADICTGNIISGEENFNNAAINEEDTKNTEGITTPTSTEEDLTLESLLIVDVKSDGKPLEDDKE